MSWPLDFGAIGDGLYPYLVLVLVGFLPSEIWRWFSVLVAQRIDENSLAVILSKTIATVLLTGVVVRLVINPSGELALTPLYARLGAMALAAVAYLVFERSVLAAVVCGEMAIIAATAYFVR